MSARSDIEAEVLSWPNTSSHPHRFGGVEFRFHTREIGHLHRNVLLDVPFPKRVRNELIADGKAAPHHVLPESGWISFRIRNQQDVANAISLLRRSYEIAANQKVRQGAKRA
ncbi:MAG: luciferase family protein [Anaerolineales bacterium]